MVTSLQSTIHDCRIQVLRNPVALAFSFSLENSIFNQLQSHFIHRQINCIMIYTAIEMNTHSIANCDMVPY